MPVAWGEGRVRGSTHVRVYFADTDQMGVVYHGVYLTWFEIGRTELLRDRGTAYAEVERRGISLPVTEAWLRVRRPARYDDRIRIETELASLRSREMTFEYRLFREDQLLVEGKSIHVAVATSGGAATSIPDWLRRAVS